LVELVWLVKACKGLRRRGRELGVGKGKEAQKIGRAGDLIGMAESLFSFLASPAFHIFAPCTMPAFPTNPIKNEYFLCKARKEKQYKFPTGKLNPLRSLRLERSGR
jgi:hypothetical protein